MIKIIYIPNKLLDSTFSRELFRREIERKEGFRVIEVNLDIEKALSAASVSGPDVLIISPAEQENKFNEQIESVVSFRRANPGSCPPDALILSNRISEYAARRLSDADMMYQFVKPLTRMNWPISSSAFTYPASKEPGRTAKKAVSPAV